jgi:hypothetical protein
MRKSKINWYMCMKCDNKIQAGVIAIHSKVFMFLWQETCKFFWSCYFEVQDIFLDSEITQQCYSGNQAPLLCYQVEIKPPYSAIKWKSSPLTLLYSGNQAPLLCYTVEIKPPYSQLPPPFPDLVSTAPFSPSMRLTFWPPQGRGTMWHLSLLGIFYLK